MTAYVRITLVSIIVLGMSLALNCSQPLTTDPAITNSPTDRTDTLIVHDTVVVIDTIVVTDTIMTVDTVIVHLPVYCTSKKICAQLGAKCQELVWLFVNGQGRYRLEFVALAEKFQPAQILVVNVDGEEFEWNPSEDAKRTLELDLVEHSAVTISTKNPSAFGHAIDICLWVKKL